MAEFIGDPDTIAKLINLHEKDRVRLLQDAAAEAAAAGVGVLVQAAPKDMGLLRQSVHVDKTEHGFDLVVDAPHASIVELGARPHMPPFGPIFRWVERHFPGANAHAITESIRQKIASQGIQPTHFVLGSIPKLADILMNVVRIKLDRIP